MGRNLIAEASIRIDASIDAVWDALVNPVTIKKYMFGTEVVSDWKKNGSIVWKGVWQGKPYEDKGSILRIEPKTALAYTHFSPLSGESDVPENYHTLSFALSEQAGSVGVTLSQDNNRTEEEREHSLKMWETMLERLKNLLETRAP